MGNFGSLTDEELALLYVGGNNGAFDELLLRNQTKLFNYIMFVVRDQELANDIFQDTFVKVITRLQEGRYSVTGKFSFWITRIAHNVIMDWYRQQHNEHVVDLLEDNDVSNSQNTDVIECGREHELVNEQVLIDVKRMMNNLPTPQREVVYMRFYQELSFKEIAEVTGVSINTALGRMRYAIINLRRMVHEYDMALSLAV